MPLTFRDNDGNEDSDTDDETVTLTDVLPDISRVSEMQRVRSGWLNGVKGLGVRYSGCPVA